MKKRFFIKFDQKQSTVRNPKLSFVVSNRFQIVLVKKNGVLDISKRN
jgi:hypothetical protein